MKKQSTKTYKLKNVLTPICKKEIKILVISNYYVKFCAEIEFLVKNKWPNLAHRKKMENLKETIYKETEDVD